LRSVRGLCGIHLDDQLGEPLLVALPGAAFGLRSDPGEVVAAVSDQGPAQPFDAEPGTAGVNEGEPVTRCTVMDQRFRGLAQDLILAAQILNLALAATKFGAPVRGQR
jgi:hypothetical protein